MDSYNFHEYNALVIPSDGRSPRIETLRTTPLPFHGVAPQPFRCGERPYPEIFMDYITKRKDVIPWSFEVCSPAL